MGLLVHVAVRWSDMDAFGHVNNVQVLRLLEEARIGAFAELGGEGPTLLDTGVLVARHEVEYRRPLAWRAAPVPVRLWVTAVGGASFDLGYAIGGAAGDPAEDPAAEGGVPGGGADDPPLPPAAVTALAASTMVAVDGPGGAPRRLGAAERTVLRGWLGEPVPFRRRGPAPATRGGG